MLGLDLPRSGFVQHQDPEGRVPGVNYVGARLSNRRRTGRGWSA